MKKILLTILLVILFFTVIFGLCYFESYLFNNGFCINCGEKYVAVSRSKNGQTYYECPSCYFDCYH